MMEDEVLGDGIEKDKMNKDTDDGVALPCHSPPHPDVQHLLEENKSKQLIIETLKNENRILKEQQQQPQHHAQPATDAIAEFQLALKQRDEIIGQLEARLSDCVAHRDELSEQREMLSREREMFIREIEVLKLQLNETAALSKKDWGAGFSQRDYIQLKNKLIVVQHDRVQDKETLDQLAEKLKQKSESLGNVESKYKHCLQKYKQLEIQCEKFRNELKSKSAEVERLESAQLLLDQEKVKWEEQTKVLLEQLREKDEDLKTLRKEEEEVKSKTSGEIQGLMLELQEMSSTLNQLKEEEQTQRRIAEEQFGLQITTMKEKMREQHSLEMSELKDAHNLELIKVTEQLDDFEKTHRQAYSILQENVTSLDECNLSLREQLEKQTEKIQQVEFSKQELIEEKNQLHKSLQDVMIQLTESQDCEKTLGQKLEEKIKDNQKILEQLEEEMKKSSESEESLNQLRNEFEKLREVYGDESKKRVMLDNKLSETLKGLQDISGEKLKLEKDLENRDQQIDSLSCELDKVRASQLELKAYISELQEKHAEAQSRLNQCDIQINEMTLDHKKILEEKHEWTLEKKNLNEKVNSIEKLNTQVTELEARLKDKEDSLNCLEGTHAVLKKRCEELSQFEQQFKDLKERFGKTEMEPSEFQNRMRSYEDMRLKYLALLEKCQVGEEKRKNIESECEDRCSALNARLQSLDAKLAEASKLSGEYAGNVAQNFDVKEKINILISRLTEMESKSVRLESELKTSHKEKETLTSELEAAQMAYVNMEKEKNDCEGECDRLKEQYRMMEAELASTMLALDKEVQLSTHRKLTSFSLSCKDQIVQTSSDYSGFEEESAHRTEVQSKVELNCNISLPPQRSNEVLIKELMKLKNEVKDQNINIRALESKNFALRQSLAVSVTEKEELIEAQCQLQRDIRGKCELQTQLSDSQLELASVKQRFKDYQKEMIQLQAALKRLMEDKSLDCATDVKEVLVTTETSIEALKDETYKSSKYILTYMIGQNKDVHNMCQSVQKSSSNHLELLNQLGFEQKKKRELENENLCLRLKVEKLSSLDDVNEVDDGATKESEANVNEASFICNVKEHENLQFENESLKTSLKKRNLQLDLENLLLRSPSQHCEISSTVQGVASMVMNESMSIQEYVLAALKILELAVVKNVCESYEDDVRATVSKIDKAVARILGSFHPSSVFKSSEDEAKCLQVQTLQQTDEDSITEKVEYLITARSTLIEAANEFAERVKEMVDSEMAPLIKEIQHQMKIPEASVSVDVNREYAAVELASMNSPPEQLLQEIEEITTNINQQAHTEKLQILKNQELMVHKILEDNQAKLNRVCHEHIDNIKKAKDVGDAVECSSELVITLEKTLSDEVAWVEQQYKELLEQYSHEQNLRTQSHALALQELKIRLATLLNNEYSKQHLVSLYNDRDYYKKTVKLLSHVTLQLLQYYSTVENYTHKCQDPQSGGDKDEVNVHSLQPSEMIVGKAHDLSFFSDCIPDDDENQLNSFTEDAAVSTLLISKLVYGDQREDVDLGERNPELIFDSTMMSEGMLEDMEKDEQDRYFLTKSYPQLISILKGCWDHVIINNLEKEVQELTISLQASAGMLKIFLHSASAENQGPILATKERSKTETSDASNKTVVPESQLPLTESKTDIDIQKKEEERSSVKVSGVQSSQGIEEKRSNEKDENVTDSGPLSHVDKSVHELSQNSTNFETQSESLNFTELKLTDLEDDEKVKFLLQQLYENAKNTEDLQLNIHHLEGLLRGLEDEKINLSEENERIHHYNKKLAVDLQNARDQVTELELEHQRRQGNSMQYTARMEASKDSKERVRAMLAAKSKSAMDRGELIARVGDLEGMLESVVREYDSKMESLNIERLELSQQLEAADRQVRSYRDFVAEQAKERDQELEEINATNTKITTQLREKEASLAQYANMEREMENLERALREKSRELEIALNSLEKTQNDLKVAVDKIWDLRDIIHSLEAQVDAKCLLETELNSKIETLNLALVEANQRTQDLTSQLEELQVQNAAKKNDDSKGNSSEQHPQGSGRSEDSGHLSNVSVSQELRDDDVYGSQDISGQALLQIVEECIERTTHELETLTHAVSSGSQSDDDLSLKDNVDAGYAIPVTSIGRRLEDKLITLERTSEAALKYTRDLEMTVKNVRRDNEANLNEVLAEREALKECSNNQLMEISSLQARLDELRCLQNPVNDELKQRLQTVQDELEKKRSELTVKGREVEELKFKLSSILEKLKSREEELQRLTSVTQPHSLPQTSVEIQNTNYRQLEKELSAKNECIEELKGKLREANKDDSITPSLAECLLDEKNAEIDSSQQRIKNFKMGVTEVLSILKNGGSTSTCIVKLQNILGLGSGSGDESTETFDTTQGSEQLRRQPTSEHSLSVDTFVKEGLTPVTVTNSTADDDVTGGSPSSISFIIPHNQKDLSQVSCEFVVDKSRTRPTLTAVEANIDLTANDTNDPREEKAKGSSQSEAVAEEVVTITKEEYESLFSAREEATYSRVHIELLKKEISSLNDFQKKLEDDYRSAQEILKEREEEIEQLTEEVEGGALVPLPSETLHFQEKCQLLEEQVARLQEELDEVTVALEEYKSAYEALNLKTQHHDTDALKDDENEHKEEICRRKNDAVSDDLICDQNQKTSELDKEVLSLNKEVDNLKQQLSDKSLRIHEMEESITQLSHQLNVANKEIEKLFPLKKKIPHLEHQYQKEISDLKEEHILREKKLCCEYEERLAVQVGDLSAKLVYEKKEALSRQKQHYEVALQEVRSEKDKLEKELKELQEHRLTDDSTNKHLQICQLCDSVDALSAGIRQELNKSSRLDRSLVSFVREGQDREGTENYSTRASSAVSDVSEDDQGDVATRIRQLMQKVHQEGIQVLSLTEMGFLQQHSMHLDTSQRFLLNQKGLSAEKDDSKEISPQRIHRKSEANAVLEERTQLLRHIASLEEEFSKKEREVRRKVESAEFRLEQEKMVANEMRLSLESEKKRARELSEQLRRERLCGVDQFAELTRLRSQDTVLQMQLQKAHEENNGLREQLENTIKQLESLQGDLQKQRNNFSRVSKVLNYERRLANMTSNQQNEKIKDLCIALEKERSKVDSLSTQLSEANHNTTRANRNITTSKPTIEDIQIQLAIEQEHVTELQRAFDREQHKVLSLNDQMRTERAQAKVELLHEQDKSAELTKMVKTLESEKETLITQMRHDEERLNHHEARIRELERDARKYEVDMKSKEAAHQLTSHKIREENAEIHVLHTRTLNKLEFAEAEICSLQHQIRSLTKDLQIAKEREEQIQQELNTERLAVNRLGLPALARNPNLNEYYELQVKQNVELCKSLLRLTEDRHSTRMKIINLQSTVTDLTEQLMKARATADNSNHEQMLERERQSWEEEINSLRTVVSQKERQLIELRSNPASRRELHLDLDDNRMQHLHRKYLQSESWRKALIWQKRYLLVVIKGYKDNEEHTISRLRNMATKVHGAKTRDSSNAGKRKLTFRIAVLVVRAVCRMQFMLQRWKHKTRLRQQVPYYSAAVNSNPSTPDDVIISRTSSCDSLPGAALHHSREVRSELHIRTSIAETAQTSFTGQTPPTKEKPVNLNVLKADISRRNLFEDRKPVDQGLDQYIERLDNIHSKLGLNAKK